MRIGWAVIDADIVAYRAASAAEPTYWDVVVGDTVLESFRYKKEAETWVAAQPLDKQPLFKYVKGKKIEPVSYACQIAKTMMQNIMEEVKPIAYKAYLSAHDESNFRYEVGVTKPYKANRGERPTHLAAVEEYLIDRWGAEVIYGEEADDALGRFQYDRAVRIEEDGIADDYDMSCIVSVDKDLKQIPGLHYNPVTKKWDHVSYDEGVYFLYVQALTGDSTDNIPGIPGIGVKKAEKILQGLHTREELDNVCLEQYCKAFGENGEEMYDEQFELVHIRTQ